MKKLAVLVSGTGSLLQAMIDARLPISFVAADRPCKGLERATAASIETRLLARKDFKRDGVFDRDRYTEAMLAELQSRNIELVAMAGFMTVFSPLMFERFRGQILNTHPSLLPDFKGEQAVADALAARAKESGFTIHEATAKLDDGPILAQERVPVLPGDTVETLWERIKEKERARYPALLKELLERPS